MSTVQSEQVMVVPTSLLHECGYFQGFCADPGSYLERLLDPSNTRYLPREKMETDPSFKQLIPYCIFQYTDDAGGRHVFQYQRGTGQGESRLHRKRSIGIGGHVSTVDIGDQCPYEVGMQRELDEEVRIETEFRQHCVGLINDDENDVGRVHLGVVHLFEVAEPKVHPNETDIASAGFQPVGDLLASIDEFETWSQICLQALYRNTGAK